MPQSMMLKSTTETMTLNTLHISFPLINELSDNINIGMKSQSDFLSDTKKYRHINCMMAKIGMLIPALSCSIRYAKLIKDRNAYASNFIFIVLSIILLSLQIFQNVSRLAL
jgi:hypothetical protein